MWAATQGHLEVIKAIIAHALNNNIDAKILGSNKFLCTHGSALALANKHGRKEIADFLKNYLCEIVRTKKVILSDPLLKLIFDYC